MLQAWKFIREDKADHYKTMAALIPLGRTPMDKRGGKALTKYQRDIERSLNALTPWRNKHSALRERLLRQGVKPGEIVVVLGPGESADSPLYEGAKIIREKNG